MKHILSTMTNSIAYTVYENVNNLPTPKKKIVIQGGAGLPSLKSGFGEMQRTEDGVPIWTAAGFVTPVSDENYEYLKEHRIFKSHLEKGLVKVLMSDLSGNHKAVVAQVRTMEKSDGFEQLTPSTAKDRLKVKVVQELEADVQFRL